MSVKNPFEIDGEAGRYDSFRPHYHHLPFSKIREFFGKDFQQSLDIACGTGHSSVALKQISKSVIGCDISESMLKVAKKNEGIQFDCVPAEDLPYQEKSFDFVNISMGFHWLDQERALSEIKRVLTPKGYLNIDNYGFDGIVSSVEVKQKSHHDFFKENLPKAFRGRGFPEVSLLDQFNLRRVKDFSYGHTLELNADEFVNLIMTWSNFQIQKEEDKVGLEAKMHKIYGKIFENQPLSLTFKGKSSLYSFI